MRNLSVLVLIGAAGLAASSANAAIGISGSTAAFVDISTTGTSVGTISDDSENTVAGATHNWIGNGLFAGGMSIRVGNNGGILWGTSATDTFTNATDVGYINSTTLPTMTASNTSDLGNGNNLRQFVAPLWDDNFPGTGASTKWQVIGNDLIVQWTNQDHFNAQGTGFITYEAIFHGGVTIASGLSLVDFVYQDTSYQPLQYQNDGGSATIGYKNWGLNASANDVEFGTGGGDGTVNDPAFNGANMQPKVAGYLAADNSALTHAVKIYGVPAPSAAALLGLGGLIAARRRRN